ncbi:MAG: hypothetical protein K6G06_04975, partial [Butyrivibrio sp.]|nr:hypothetical protein [Butyrivibrio sp.]
MTSRVKDVALRTTAKVSAFLTLASARATMVFCGDPPKPGSGGTSAFTKAATAADNLQSELYDLAMHVFPVAIIICAVAMFFTRDQKKFDTEKRILIGCCAAFLLVLIVGNATFGEDNIMVQTMKVILPDS